MFRLSSLILFLVLYLGTSVVLKDFYSVPIAVAFLLSAVYAILAPGGTYKERIDSFTKGVGESTVGLMLLIFILSGAFAATEEGEQNGDLISSAIGLLALISCARENGYENLTIGAVRQAVRWIVGHITDVIDDGVGQVTVKRKVSNKKAKSSDKNISIDCYDGDTLDISYNVEGGYTAEDGCWTYQKSTNKGIL